MGSVHPHAERGSSARQVLDADDIARSLTRIAFEIIERNGEEQTLVIAGIPTRGATLSKRLVEKINEVGGRRAQLAIIDTTMFRDDLSSQPLREPKESFVPADGIDGRTVILVDDVLYTGRTIKAALDALTSIGRPKADQLADLVDLPIRPDYVGKNLPTARDESVSIWLNETDGEECVLIERNN